MIRFLTVLLVVCIMMPLLLSETASAYTPPRTVLRIGMNWGNTAIQSANLQNEVGSGYEFGFYDANLVFTPVAATTETRLSIMIDHNMVWNPAGAFSGEYNSIGTSNPAPGGVAVGCWSLRINNGRTTLAAAQADLAGYDDGYIKYMNGVFIPMYGRFFTRASAESGRRITSHAVDSGTANTITVTRTGSNVILFKYDNSAAASMHFGIRPIGNPRPSTHYRGERFYGGFRFERRAATVLTIVNIVNIEDYVQGVVPYEMSNSWPIEALKAQALCARTYAMSMLNKHNSQGFDLCTEMDCQVYRGRRLSNAATDRAVNETAGMYITHNGRLAETFYVSSNGGASENSENIWSAAQPYLKGVMDPYEADVVSRISGYNWERTMTQAEVTTRVRATHPNAVSIVSMWVSQYTPTGNVLSVTLRDANGRDYVYSRRAGLQSALGVDAIRSHRFNIGSTVWQPGSTLFVNSPARTVVGTTTYSVIGGDGRIVSVPSTGMIAIDGSGTNRTVVGGGSGTTSGTPTAPVNGIFTIRGTGWGHNVGMSQWGAFSQAQHHGRTAEQIIQFYFTGVTIVRT